MAVQLNYSDSKNERNMTPYDSVCANQSAADSDACDKDAQGINLATPIVMMTFGVLGNILALLVLYSSRREAQARRTVFFVMLAGLAWTDLIGQIAVGPIAVITYANGLKWVGGVHLCRYHGLMMVAFGVVTPLVVCCMSIERFLAIRFSYFYARRVTRRKAQLTFLACWGVTVVFTMFPFIGFGSYENQFPGSWCFLNFHRESTLDSIYAAMFASLNIVAIVIMIMCNVNVSWTLLRMRKSRHLNSSPSIDRRFSVSNNGSCAMSGTIIRTRKHSDMEAQMIWFLGLITIAFSVCWLPLNVHILVMQFTGTNNIVLDLKFIRMASSNQILDPWLYVIFRKNSLLRIIRRMKSCLNPKTLGKEPPRHGPHRVPPVRYIMGNKSFTCEATTVGKTLLGVNKCTNAYSPKRNTGNDMIKENSHSEDSNDSDVKLMSAYSYKDYDCQNACHSALSQMIAVSLGQLPGDPRFKNFGFDPFDQMSKSTKVSEIVMSDSLKQSPHRTSMPVFDAEGNNTESKGGKRYVNNVRSPNDQTTHDTVTKFKQKEKVKQCNSSPANMFSNDTSKLKNRQKLQNNPPKNLQISSPVNFLSSPPLASPERLSNSFSNFESCDESPSKTPKDTSESTVLHIPQENQFQAKTLKGEKSEIFHSSKPYLHSSGEISDLKSQQNSPVGKVLSSDVEEADEESSGEEESLTNNTCQHPSLHPCGSKNDFKGENELKNQSVNLTVKKSPRIISPNSSGSSDGIFQISTAKLTSPMSYKSPECHPKKYQKTSMDKNLCLSNGFDMHACLMKNPNKTNRAIARENTLPNITKETGSHAESQSLLDNGFSSV